MSQAAYKVRKGQQVDAIFKNIHQAVIDIQSAFNINEKITNQQIDSLVNNYRNRYYQFCIRHDPIILGFHIYMSYMINTYNHIFGMYIINQYYINIQAIYMANNEITKRLDILLFNSAQNDDVARIRFYTTFRAYEQALIELSRNPIRR